MQHLLRFFTSMLLSALVSTSAIAQERPKEALVGEDEDKDNPVFTPKPSKDLTPEEAKQRRVDVAALDVRGQTLLVGASARQNPAEQGGHVFAFRRSGAGAMWAHDGEVYRAFDDQGLDDVMIGDEFGSDVAIVRVEGGAFPIEAFVIAAPGRGRTYYIIPPQGMNAMSSKGIVTDTRQHTFLTTCGGRFVAGAGGHDGGRGIIDIPKLSVMMDGSIGVISEESISPLGTGNDNGGDRFGGAIACWGSGIATSAVYRAVDGRSAVGEVFYIDID